MNAQNINDILVYVTRLQFKGFELPVYQVVAVNDGGFEKNVAGLKLENGKTIFKSIATIPNPFGNYTVCTVCDQPIYAFPLTYVFLETGYVYGNRFKDFNLMAFKLDDRIEEMIARLNEKQIIVYPDSYYAEIEPKFLYYFDGSKKFKKTDNEWKQI